MIQSKSDRDRVRQRAARKRKQDRAVGDLFDEAEARIEELKPSGPDAPQKPVMRRIDKRPGSS